MGGAIEPTASGGTLVEADDGAMIETLPKEAGLFLILIGVGGVLLPGPIGTPFLVLGLVAFFPKFFRGVDAGLQRRFPKAHRQGMQQVHRFVDDLERRYPSGA